MEAQIQDQSTSHPHQSNSNSEAEAAKNWLNPGIPGSSNAPIRIQRARIFVVPDATRSEAIVLLKEESIVPLNNDQVKYFMGENPSSGDEIVEKTIADAEAESKLIGGIPSTESITYARTLYGKLKPYLVRAVAANPAGTIFTSVFCGVDLCVSNGSLGNYNYVRKPIIIFLERKPEHIWIKVRSIY